MPAKADPGRRPPRLYVFFGLIATGKSTLAAAWAAQHQLAYANSDVVRKELAGLLPTASRREVSDHRVHEVSGHRVPPPALMAAASPTAMRTPVHEPARSPQDAVPCTRLRQEAAEQGIYTPEFSRKTYDELLKRAEAELRRGRDMVLDASYLDRTERQRVVALAAQTGAECRFILCDCSDRVKQERLALRARDPQAVSDGRWEIYLRQREKFQPPDELPAAQLITIDTDQPLNALLAALARQLP